MCRWHHPYGRKWRITKELLNEIERGEWKVGLKLNIQKTMIMASGPITSWEIDGETMETVTDFIFLEITANGDCSHEIKRCLLLGRKAMTNLDGILKSWEITLPTKVHLVKATVFPAPFIEGAVFAPLYILACFVKNKVSIGAWVYFWAFYLVPLVYISVFVPVPYCLDGCSFVV